MPQADEWLRAEMERRFGDPVSDCGPMRFLEQRGWKLGSDWLWRKGGSTIHNCPRDEFDCILFLIHEWDFNNEYPKAIAGP